MGRKAFWAEEAARAKVWRWQTMGIRTHLSPRIRVGHHTVNGSSSGHPWDLRPEPSTVLSFLHSDHNTRRDPGH